MLGFSTRQSFFSLSFFFLHPEFVVSEVGTKMQHKSQLVRRVITCCTMDDTVQNDTSSSTTSYSVEVNTLHINAPRRQGTLRNTKWPFSNHHWLDSQANFIPFFPMLHFYLFWRGGYLNKFRQLWPHWRHVIQGTIKSWSQVRDMFDVIIKWTVASSNYVETQFPHNMEMLTVW